MKIWLKNQTNNELGEQEEEKSSSIEDEELEGSISASVHFDGFDDMMMSLTMTDIYLKHPTTEYGFSRSEVRFSMQQISEDDRNSICRLSKDLV